jgi:hypothetical protein
MDRRACDSCGIEHDASNLLDWRCIVCWQDEAIKLRRKLNLALEEISRLNKANEELESKRGSFRRLVRNMTRGPITFGQSEGGSRSDDHE